MRAIINILFCVLLPSEVVAQQINVHNFGNNQIINILSPDIGLKFTSQPYVISSLAKYPILADPTLPQWLGSRYSSLVDGVAVEAAYEDFLKGKRIIENVPGVGRPQAFDIKGDNNDSQPEQLAAATKALDNSIAESASGWAYLYRGIARAQLRAFHLADLDFRSAEKWFSSDQKFRVPLEVTREFARVSRRWGLGKNDSAQVIPLFGTCPDTPDKSRAALGGEMGICSLLFCAKGTEQTSEERAAKIVPVLRKTLDALRTSAAEEERRNVVYACAAHVEGIQSDLRIEIDRMLLAFAIERDDKSEILRRFGSLEQRYFTTKEVGKAIDLITSHSDILQANVGKLRLALRYVFKRELDGRQLREILTAIHIPEGEQEAYVGLQRTTRRLDAQIAILSDKVLTTVDKDMGHNAITARLLHSSDLVSLIMSLAEGGDNNSVDQFINEIPRFLSSFGRAVNAHAATPEALAAIDDYEQALSQILALPEAGQSYLDLNRKLNDLTHFLAAKLSEKAIDPATEPELIAFSQALLPYGRYLARTLITDAMSQGDMKDVEGLARFLEDRNLHQSLADLLERRTKPGVGSDKVRGLLADVLVGVLSYIPAEASDWAALLPADKWVTLSDCGLAWLRTPEVMSAPKGSCVSPVLSAVNQLIRNFLISPNLIEPKFADALTQLLNAGSLSARQSVAKGDPMGTAWVRGITGAFSQPTLIAGWKALSNDHRLILRLLSMVAGKTADEAGVRRQLKTILSELPTEPKSNTAQATAYLVFALAHNKLPPAEAAAIGRRLYGGNRLAQVSVPAVRIALLSDPNLLKTLDGSTITSTLDSSASAYFNGNEKVGRLISMIAISRGVTPLNTPFTPDQVDALINLAPQGRQILRYWIPVSPGFETLAYGIMPEVLDNLSGPGNNSFKLNIGKSAVAGMERPWFLAGELDLPDIRDHVLLLQIVAGAKAGDWPRVKEALAALLKDFHSIGAESIASNKPLGDSERRYGRYAAQQLVTACAAVILQRTPPEEIASDCNFITNTYLSRDGTNPHAAQWALAAYLRDALRGNTPASDELEAGVMIALDRLSSFPKLNEHVRDLSTKTFLANALEYAVRYKLKDMAAAVRTVKEKAKLLARAP